VQGVGRNSAAHLGVEMGLESEATIHCLTPYVVPHSIKRAGRKEHKRTEGVNLVAVMRVQRVNRMGSTSGGWEAIGTHTVGDSGKNGIAERHRKSTRQHVLKYDPTRNWKE